MIWLVGAGPGDAGLFTLRGYEVLKRADVVIYDHLIGEAIRVRLRGMYVGNEGRVLRGEVLGLRTEAEKLGKRLAEVIAG